MTPQRCAWCGAKLESAAAQTDFCDKTCQHAYEDWCSARAAVRAQAVSRWRDMQQAAKGGDMLNELLSFGAKSSAQSYFASVGAGLTRPQR